MPSSPTHAFLKRRRLRRKLNMVANVFDFRKTSRKIARYYSQDYSPIVCLFESCFFHIQFVICALIIFSPQKKFIRPFDKMGLCKSLSNTLSFFSHSSFNRHFFPCIVILSFPLEISFPFVFPPFTFKALLH